MESRDATTPGRGPALTEPAGDLFELSPLFGETAMALGLCRPSEVVDALCFQDDLRSFGVEPGRLGQILVERGHLSSDEVLRIMEEIESRTLRLRLPGFEDLRFERIDGTTRVYRGREAATGRAVSVHILRFALAERPEEVQDFRARAERLRELDHPTLEPVRAIRQVEGVPWLAFDRAPGPDLGTRVREGGALSEQDGLELLALLGGGLRHAHARQVVHGGLCPEAIRLSRSGGPRIEGFRLTDAPARHLVDRPRYAAPELVRDGGPATVCGDVYSLGATMFFALTGRPPFLGEPQEVVRQHRRRHAPDPRVIVPSLSESTAALLRRMLGTCPEERPADLEEVLRALGEAAASAARPEPPRPPGRLLSRRSRR